MNDKSENSCGREEASPWNVQTCITPAALERKKALYGRSEYLGQDVFSDPSVPDLHFDYYGSPLLDDILLRYRRPVTQSARDNKCKYDSGMERSDEYRLIEEIKNVSMLHWDTLALLHHFAKTGEGSILEIGANRGGGTLAICSGLADGDRQRAFISAECVPEIWGEAQGNLQRFGYSDRVDLLKGFSFDEQVRNHIYTRTAADPIGLLLIDSGSGNTNGNYLRDEFDRFLPHCRPGCILVMDDYVIDERVCEGKCKTVPVQEAVHELVAAGRVFPFGVYLWSTWFGVLL